jgi:subtilisin family serine protease
MRFYTLFLSSALLLCIHFPGFSQRSSAPTDWDWFLRDPETDHVQGVSAEKAYGELLQGRPARTIIVAIIDSGIDIDHEDLKNVLWTNPGEIPGNGTDDDKNGYTDDIHGWYFIGSKAGDKEVNEDTYELTREYIRLEKKFGAMNEDQVSSKEKKEYAAYKKIKDKYTRLRDSNKSEYDYYVRIQRNLAMSMDTLKAVFHVDTLTRAAIDTFRSTNPTLSFAKGFTMLMLKNADDNEDLESIQKSLQETVDYYRVIVEFGYNGDFDSRLLVGDNPTDPRERHYGNNNVEGPDPTHGTHVAGIVAADRSNDIGMKGIADHVRIMSLRAIPNGDERDKDVANAIRYAVDNGANIINMSFGKSISPEKYVVDDAVAYAEQKGVLLVHGSGNEKQDNDKEGNFPNRRYLSGKEARNWLEVGASSSAGDEHLVGDFSNYGRKTVDVFAPGVDVYSTMPNNAYGEQSGTSMAAPVVTGVAALVWSYFPDLTANELVEILKSSTRKFDGLRVKKPGGGVTSFTELSSSGGLINAYNAINMAIARQSKLTGKR